MHEQYQDSSAISLLMPSLSGSTSPVHRAGYVPARPCTPRAEGAQDHPVPQVFLLSCTPLDFLQLLQELQLWSQCVGSAGQDCSVCVCTGTGFASSILALRIFLHPL